MGLFFLWGVVLGDEGELLLLSFFCIEWDLNWWFWFKVRSLRELFFCGEAVCG